MQVTPLVQAYHDACAARGVFVSAEVADQLDASEASREFRLTGVALPDPVAASIAEVLATCKHIQGGRCSCIGGPLRSCWPTVSEGVSESSHTKAFP